MCYRGVSGPRTPSIKDACCPKLSGTICRTHLLHLHFRTATPKQCHALCQANPACKFFTQISGDVCFLYRSCKTTAPCSSCTSGVANPSWDECNQEADSQQTLLLGGKY